MPPKKIAIVGPESTGKSVLSEKLAKHYQTEWVQEYAREYLEGLGRPYMREDLAEIAKGQLAAEDALIGKANRLLVCDTNLVVIKIWSDVKYGECDQWIVDEMESRHYDLHLLMNIDLPWEYDPLREHPETRDFLFEKYEAELKRLASPYAIIGGDYRQRFERAKAEIEKILGV